MKSKPIGPKYRKLYDWHASIWCAAVGFLIAGSGCEEDRYERAARCSAMLKDGHACVEPVDFGAASILECSSIVAARLKLEGLEYVPFHTPGCETPEKVWRTVCEANASSSAEKYSCGRKCEKKANETWSERKRQEASACTFFLADFGRKD